MRDALKLEVKREIWSKQVLWRSDLSLIDVAQPKLQTSRQTQESQLRETYKGTD